MGASPQTFVSSPVTSSRELIERSFHVPTRLLIGCSPRVSDGICDAHALNAHVSNIENLFTNSSLVCPTRIVPIRGAYPRFGMPTLLARSDPASAVVLRRCGGRMIAVVAPAG